MVNIKQVLDIIDVEDSDYVLLKYKNRVKKEKRLLVKNIRGSSILNANVVKIVPPVDVSNNLWEIYLWDV